MINICTVSDENFLVKGLTLYRSLINDNSIDLTLHYLCLDDESYQKILNLNLPHLKAYHVNDLIDVEKRLKDLMIWDYKYFCWSLASFFTNYVQKKFSIDVTYIDSDIYFHEKISTVIDKIGEKSVGIFRHRQFNSKIERPEGFFNVGVVHFKNSESGRKTLEWWSDSVLFMKYPELSTCGDQKYLDRFPYICPENNIFIDGDIGHGAPWLWQLYDLSNYEKNKTILWNNNEQILYFTHFSQFVLTENSYVPSTMHHIYTPIEEYKNNIYLKKIYDDYYNELLKTKNLYL